MIPKNWKKTAYEKTVIWNAIEYHSRKLEIAAGNQDLREVNILRHEISKRVSQLERAAVADALDDSKALMKRRKKFIKLINRADERRLKFL